MDDRHLRGKRTLRVGQRLELLVKIRGCAALHELLNRLMVLPHLAEQRLGLRESVLDNSRDLRLLVCSQVELGGDFIQAVGQSLLADPRPVYP